VAKGRDTVELVRAAAGGPALTALRSLEITGRSVMTGLKVPRQFNAIALFPLFYRQEEATETTGAVPGFHTTIGFDGTAGWMKGAALAGDGRSKDRNVAMKAYTRAARQTMAGFMAGIDTPWLLDTGRYTFTDAGTVDAGADKGAMQLLIDGPDGRVGKLLIDPGTHLPRRLIEAPLPGNGGNAAVTDTIYTYSDFQTQNGVQLPRTIVRDNTPTRTTWSIAKYTLNPKLTARRFLVPKR